MKKRIILGTALAVLLCVAMTSTRSCGGNRSEKEEEKIEEVSEVDTNLEELEQE